MEKENFLILMMATDDDDDDCIRICICICIWYLVFGIWYLGISFRARKSGKGIEKSNLHHHTHRHT
jgi:hypothetical protein